ncbi:MAG: O-antigen ligase family protein [Saccharospirillaceae bacterium]|nr:hypothetical protein A3759_13640 [Thalassolituus sp. HI0120]MCH2042181.1 O-antigen ligase family protein [Saccharospirillaceae bacterium]
MYFENSSINSAKLLNTVVFSLICCFLAIHAWNQSPVTDAAIGLWLIGLSTIICRKGKVELSTPQLKIILSSCVVFLSSLSSWLLASYDVEVINLEPDLRFLFLPLVMIAVIQARITSKQLILALVFAGISYGFSSIYQRYELGIFRVHGDENPVTYGNGAFLIFACLLFSIFSKPPKLVLIGIVVSAPLALYAAYLSGTRGSFLALPPLLLLLLYLLRGWQRVFGIVVSIILLLAASNIGYVEKQIDRTTASFSRFVQSDDENSSTGQRLLYWEKAICMTTKHPVFGSGPLTYKESMQDQESSCTFKSSSGYVNQAHSVYLQTLATKGIVGLVAIVTFFLTMIFVSLRQHSKTGIMTTAAIIAMMSYGITVDLLFKVSVADRHIVLLGILTGIGLKKR